MFYAWSKRHTRLHFTVVPHIFWDTRSPRFLKLCWYNKICILDLTYCNLILCFTRPRGKKEIVAIKPILYFFLYIFFSVSLQNTVNNYIHLYSLPKLVITTSLTNNKLTPLFYEFVNVHIILIEITWYSSSV